MPLEYQFNKLDIIETLSITEKIIQLICNIFGYGFGYLSHIFSLSWNGLKCSFKGFRNQSFSYIENGERIWRRLECKDGLSSDFYGLKTITSLFKNSVNTYGNNKCMGFRNILAERLLEEKEGSKAIVKWQLSSFEWISYSEAYSKIKSCSTFLKSIGVKKQSKIGMFAESSPDWIMLTMAAIEIGAIVVTVYPTLPDESIEIAFNQTEPQIIFVDAKSKDRISFILPKIPSICTVICSSKCPVENKRLILDDRVIAYTHFIHISSSSTCNSTNEKEEEEINETDVAIIMYTSGSTGIPKGVMISHKNIIAIIGAVSRYKEYWSGITYPGYLPLSHILELITELTIFAYGGNIGYCTPLTLIDNGPMLEEGCKGDLTLLRPDALIAVPLILERIKKNILEKIKCESRLTQVVFQTVYNIRAYFFHKGYDTPIINRIFFKRIRRVLGGNLKYGMMGGASISPETEIFICVVMGLFKQAYGLTETCCGGAFSNLDYYRPGNCGPIIGCSEIKLVEWVEGGYSPNDSEGPRGEIVICGDNVAQGYYKNEELTNEVFKVDALTGKRWFYTGDIGQITDDGTLRIIDRKKDIIKLSHGEYIPLGRVESFLAKSKYVEMVCVATDKQSSSLVAIVSPNRIHVEKLATTFQTTSKLFEEIIKDNKIIEIMKEDIIKNAKSAGLARVEIPSKVFFVGEIWTPESGLVTPSMKIKRLEICKKYSELLL